MLNPQLFKNILNSNKSNKQTRDTTPLFCRSQRVSYKSQQSQQSQQSNVYNFRQQFIDQESTKNYIQQKSNFLLKADDKLIEHINKQMIRKRQNSKMSILSMRKYKFKVSKRIFQQRRTTKITKNNDSFQNDNAHKQCLLSNISSKGKRQSLISASSCELFQSYLKIISFNHQKRNKSRKSQILVHQILKYFLKCAQKQLKQSIQQILLISKSLSACLSCTGTTWPSQCNRELTYPIPNLLYQICYQTHYALTADKNRKQKIKINKQIQYWSRKATFNQLTLRTTFDLAKIYTDNMMYQKAFQQYTNAIKLSVVLGNKYYQEIAIDRLGVCKYYMGDTVSAYYFHNNVSSLSAYDKIRIKQQYSNQHQLQRLMEQKKSAMLAKRPNLAKLRSKKISIRQVAQSDDNKQNQDIRNNQISTDSTEDTDCAIQNQKLNIGEFTFSKQSRLQSYPLKNNLQFKKNLKKIIKVPQLRDKIHIIKNSLTKNQQIGVKKYSGQHYIVPKASKFMHQPNIQSNEVCMTHRSLNRNDMDYQNEGINKDVIILLRLIGYFQNQTYIKRRDKTKP